MSEKLTDDQTAVFHALTEQDPSKAEVGWPEDQSVVAIAASDASAHFAPHEVRLLNETLDNHYRNDVTPEGIQRFTDTTRLAAAVVRGDRSPEDIKEAAEDPNVSIKE